MSVYGTDPCALTLGSFSWRALHPSLRRKYGAFARRSEISRHECQTNKALGLMSLVTPSQRARRAGILTCCPSAAVLTIALGPPNPWLIDSATETLDLRGLNFSLGLWLLMPTFSLPSAPVALAGQPSLRSKCSPTTLSVRRPTKSVFSVTCLAPVHFRRITPSNSELLHTL